MATISKSKRTLPFERESVWDINEYSKTHDVGSASFLKLFHGGREYMTAKPWVVRITQIWVGKIIDDRAGVFLYEIAPISAKVDRLHWVICGEVPSAYLVLDKAKNPAEAIEQYCIQVRKWIEGVRAGQLLPHTMPIEWPQSFSSAERLSKMLFDVFEQ
jgi:hypothetical protein